MRKRGGGGEEGGNGGNWILEYLWVCSKGL